jgi:hypothetical protein
MSKPNKNRIGKLKQAQLRVYLRALVGLLAADGALAGCATGAFALRNSKT